LQHTTGMSPVDQLASWQSAGRRSQTIGAIFL